MEIDIQAIAVKSNPRSDFGDLDELTASIREKGIIEPLVVKDAGDGKYELIAGERRYRAATAAGLTKVPVSVYNGTDAELEEVKLIENIHRKDFNPIEEAEAFMKITKGTETGIETLSKKISKPKLYIERRLKLLDLPEDVKKASIEGKIMLGHALLITRLDKAKDQKNLLKEIIKDKMSVSEAERQMQYQDATVRLSEAQFDKSECKGCNHNGGEQAVLFESGSDLKGICLNKRCFLKKTDLWKKSEIKKLKEKGVRVLTPKELEKIEKKVQVSKWDDDYKKILDKLHKEPENYAVVFEKAEYRNEIEKKIFCTTPSARRPKKQSQTTETEKSANAQQRLINKVSTFKRDFLIEKSQSLIQTGTKQAKAIALFSLLTEAGSWNDGDRRDVADKLIKDEGVGVKNYCGLEVRFSKILALDEKDIDRITATIAGLWIKNLGDELITGSEAFGVSLKDHFVIDEEYLKLHTKDQLIALAKEIGLDKHLIKNGNEKWDNAKRGDLITHFTESGYNLKGHVPKLMNKAKA